MFLAEYCNSWLANSDHSSHLRLTEELLDKQDYLAVQISHDNSEPVVEWVDDHVDPFTQLFTMFQRAAESGEGCVLYSYIIIPIWVANFY